nr:hypothetical protein [Tanacetum cinerariifolium]
MGYKHLNTTPKTESDEIIKSGVEELVQILSENEVEASLPDPEIVSLAEENDVYVEEEEERLINVVKNDISDDSTNDPLLKEVDLFLASDNSIPPGFENIGYDLEGDIRFLEELLIDDSIPFPVNELFDFEDDPSFPRPPPEPPDVEYVFEPNAGEEILVVMNDNDELECLDPRDENDEDDDYFPFMFVIRIFLPYLIYPEVFPLLLFADSEDTIFDPGISV